MWRSDCQPVLFSLVDLVLGRVIAFIVCCICHLCFAGKKPARPHAGKTAHRLYTSLDNAPRASARHGGRMALVAAYPRTC